MNSTFQINSKNKIFIPEHIEKLIPYSAGKPIEELVREKGLKKIVKLASNENPLGTSPLAIKAVKKNLHNLHRYTDPLCFDLTNFISVKYNKSFESIFCASGSDAILEYIIAAFTNENDEVLTSDGTFIGWYVNVKKFNRKSVLVPLKENYSYNLNAIGNAITEKTKLIYLANPNNPTGNIFTKEEFEDFINVVPENVLIILDEAYTLYAESVPSYPNGLDYNLPNLIVCRTLSKSHGLAGLRFGFAFGNPDIIARLKKVRLPFEPNILAQVAAKAALLDEEFEKFTKELNKISINLFKDFFTSNKIRFTETAANFMMLIFDSENDAAIFTESCLNMGLILRHTKPFGIVNGVRINSGTLEETEFAIDVMQNVLKNNLL